MQATGVQTGPPAISRTGTALFVLSLITGTVAVLAGAGVAWALDLGPVRVSVRHATNPALASAVLASLCAWRLGAARFLELGRRSLAALAGLGLPLAVVIALVLIAVIARHGAFVAGGSDTSGYLSEARLWLRGSLRVQVPDIGGVSFAHGLHARAPLGFRVGAGGEHIVPTYPPGLPLLMAGFARAFGDGAEFWVVPLSAGGLAVVTFLLGRRLAGPLVGLLGSAAVAASPTVLFESVIPMSDVPAACAWLGAVALLAGGTMARTLAAALVACVACLIRPNLFAMVPLLGLAALWWTPGRGPALVRAAAVSVPPALVALGFAWWQRNLYGAMTQTGYGDIGTLFALEHVVPNLQLYPAWLFASHGILLLLALPAPFLIGQSARRFVEASGTRGVAVAWWSVVMGAALFAFYLLYAPFDNWTYTRFLLPVLPLAFILAAFTGRWMASYLPAPLQVMAIVWLLVVVPAIGASRARDLGAFDLINSEQRYLEVAGFVRRQPEHAVFICMQHSGSLAYYTGAPLLRWDWIEPGEIAQVLDALRATGRPVYLTVDDWEIPQVRARFPTASGLHDTLQTPVFRSRQRAINAHVFHLSGAGPQ